MNTRSNGSSHQGPGASSPRMILIIIISTSLTLDLVSSSLPPFFRSSLLFSSPISDSCRNFFRFFLPLCEFRGLAGWSSSISDISLSSLFFFVGLQRLVPLSLRIVDIPVLPRMIARCRRPLYNFHIYIANFCRSTFPLNDVDHRASDPTSVELLSEVSVFGDFLECLRQSQEPHLCVLTGAFIALCFRQLYLPVPSRSALMVFLQSASKQCIPNRVPPCHLHRNRRLSCYQPKRSKASRTMRKSPCSRWIIVRHAVVYNRGLLLTLSPVKYFLLSAPVDWQPDQLIRRFLLPTGDYVSCVLWLVRATVAEPLTRRLN